MKRRKEKKENGSFTRSFSIRVIPACLKPELHWFSFLSHNQMMWTCATSFSTQQSKIKILTKIQGCLFIYVQSVGQWMSDWSPPWSHGKDVQAALK